MPTPVLLLFDIDGTLLDTGGAGRDSLTEALRHAFPRETALRSMPALDLAGATDSGVIRFLFSEFGLERSQANETAFLQAYLQRLQARLFHENGPPGALLSGVLPLLEHLRDLPEVTLALLTGNTRAGAQVKTEAYGLGDFFDLDCGAYGCDHWDRNRLGQVAIERASHRRGVSYRGSQVTVIGDTPRDVACGKACGARTIAVASGGFDHQALAACHPDHLLADLTKTEVALHAIMGSDAITCSATSSV